MNPVRGEVTAVVCGREVTFALTLGGLAELEGALGVKSMSALIARMSDPGVNDLITLAHVLSGGALTADDLRALPATEAKALFDVVGAAMTAAFADTGGKKNDAEAATIPATKSRRNGSSASAPA